MSSSTSVGFFGKLPVLGDFITRRLPADFVGRWDQWLQQGVAGARTQLGAEWHGAYANAAPWRFALESGVCGPAPVLGALLAGADRVGRQFPLTIAAILPAGTCALELAAHASPWYQAVESLLLQGTGGVLGAEEFDQAVHALAGLLEAAQLSVPAAADLDACRQYLLAHGAFRLPLNAAGMGASLAGMSAGLLARTAPPLALLWCESTTAEPQLFASRGLPSPALVADLLRLPRQSAVVAPRQPFAATADKALLAPAAECAAPVTAPAAAIQLSSQHAVIRGGTPHPVHAVATATGGVSAELAGFLKELDALLRDSGEAEVTYLARLSGLIASPASASNTPVAIRMAASVSRGTEQLFVWTDGATVFQLRGRDLVRLIPEGRPSEGGGSLLDLLQNDEASVSGPAATLKVARVAATDPGDRYLLCSDATYASLSWGQLVSALDESRPEDAIERLRETVGERAHGAAPALVLMFNESSDTQAPSAASTPVTVDSAAA